MSLVSVLRGVRRVRLASVPAVLALGLACGGDETSAGTTDGASGAAAGASAAKGDVDVAAVAALAKKIKAEPTNGAAILEAAGTTRDALEAQLFVIAADPALSAEYLKLIR